MTTCYTVWIGNQLHTDRDTLEDARQVAEEMKHAGKISIRKDGELVTTTAEKIEELKPCPFCGGRAVEYPDGDLEGYSICCTSGLGDCPMNTFGYSSREASIKAWNTRAPREVMEEE